MGEPDMVMIGEPIEGLGPKIVEQVSEYLLELQRRRVAVLLVAQKLTITLEVSQRCLVIGHRHVVSMGCRGGCGGLGGGREWLEV